MSETSIARICPVCKQPLRTFEQMGVPGKPAIEMGDCQDETCDLYMVTLTLGKHHKLTAERIAKYGEVRRQLEGRLARA